MLSGKRIAILAEEWFEDSEIIEPMRAMKNADVRVAIVGSGSKETYTGKRGNATVRVDTTADRVNVEDFDGIIVPGGYAPDKMRLHQSMVDLIRKAHDAGYNGGGIWVYQSSPTIVNCVITNNNAGNAGGGIYVDDSPSANITHNDVWNNSPDNYSGISDQTGTNGNISQNPQFAGAGDYHLQSGSPCIDTGDNSASNLPDTDKDGNPRIADGDGDLVVDMGAYETTIDTITIEIDIKPGSDPNSINPDSKGVIPVAIITANGFDAASVNPSTVLFGKEGTEAEPIHYSFRDVGNDGDTDMILYFKIQDTGIRAGDTEATLRGKTTDGKDIVGTDSVRTVPPKGKKTA